MYYFEINFLPTQEIPLNFLWSKVFYRMHLRLVQMQDTKGNVPIGLSFPGYAFDPVGLGNALRVFARSRDTLELFNESSPLKIFSEYVHITGIREVPQNVVYVKYERHQVGASIECLARRRAKRDQISYEDALQKYARYVREQSMYPFIKMKSDSSNKRFSLFIKKEPSSASDDFWFTTYGLSKNSSVPEF
jgi:CRISPR-associated endonuclease Csy4